MGKWISRWPVLCALLLAACAHAPAKNARPPAGRFYYTAQDYLNYETSGRGPVPVIFLHGFGASLRVWDGVLKRLPADRFRCYLLDLKGAGFSSRPRDGRYSIRDNADLLAKFIKDNGLRDYVLVGHSSGGAVVLYSAIDSLADPALKPGKLVLIDAAAYPAELPGYIKALRTPVLRNVLYALTTKRFQVRHTLGKIVYDRKSVTGEIVESYAAFMGGENYTYALWKTAEELVPEHPELYTSRYRELNCPALVVWGREDRVLPLAYGERLAGDLPHARLEVVEECGHDTPEERPEETARLIAAFAAGEKPAAGAAGIAGGGTE